MAFSSLLCQVQISRSVPENEVGVEVVRPKVTDLDKSGSPNANTIVKGNERQCFSISTGPSKMEGKLTKAKELDFENVPAFALLVVVENEEFSKLVSTSTVTVRVEDRNETPVFSPSQTHVDVVVGRIVAHCKAQDSDTVSNQTVG